MTPHEVIKDSLEKFEKEYDFINDEDEYTLDKYDVESFIEHLKSSQLSLLLSVKEMVESKKKNNISFENNEDAADYGKIYDAMYYAEDTGYDKALSDLQSLLDTEINKVKEL